MSEMKEMLETSQRDQETITILRSEVEELKRHREATEALQAPPTAVLNATVEALKLELAALKKKTPGSSYAGESGTLLQRQEGAADVSTHANGKPATPDLICGIRKLTPTRRVRQRERRRGCNLPMRLSFLCDVVWDP